MKFITLFSSWHIHRWARNVLRYFGGIWVPPAQKILVDVILLVAQKKLEDVILPRSAKKK
ncbi:CLUMA_CG020037, isoform A [Clunio marinus]|uniref:CLUMA_CG020037, isoform A n=1 Tax=Clunio marinus TaxID=568069 RepID=A0A1J1J3H4_9DIPT|nr:CLUMA_CG020037, isoform A [Clunio marinus]